MGKVIVFVNQKGGCGKSTSAYAVASILAERGNKVLFVDCDPQCNSTTNMGAVTEGVCTIFDIVADEGSIFKKEDPAEEAIQHCREFDVIAGDKELTNTEGRVYGPGKELRLKNAIKKIKDNYDFVIMDTPPNVGVLQKNALVCADVCIIPVFANKYYVENLPNVLSSIIEIKESSLNDDICVGGIVLTKVDRRTGIANEYVDQLPELSKAYTGVYKIDVPAYKTFIRIDECVNKAQQSSVSLVEYNRDYEKSRAYSDYCNLVDEILAEVKGVK